MNENNHRMFYIFIGTIREMLNPFLIEHRLVRIKIFSNNNYRNLPRDSPIYILLYIRRFTFETSYIGRLDLLICVIYKVHRLCLIDIFHRSGLASLSTKKSYLEEKKTEHVTIFFLFPSNIKSRLFLHE